MFLLDTNVLSELRRRDRTDPRVAAWADHVDASDLFLSAITILEIEAGTLMVQRRDEAQGAMLRARVGSCP
jgi:toxin FitB